MTDRELSLPMLLRDAPGEILVTFGTLLHSRDNGISQTSGSIFLVKKFRAWKKVIEYVSASCEPTQVWLNSLANQLGAANNYRKHKSEQRFRQ